MTKELHDQSPSSAIADVLAGQRETSVWQEGVYKDLHAHPELSFQETNTARLVASKLKDFGYEVVDRVGHTGVVGILRNGEGQTVLARADMDALPCGKTLDCLMLRHSLQLMTQETQSASHMLAAMTRM